jgi:lipoprotein-releasing system ATP-binding protein
MDNNKNAIEVKSVNKIYGTAYKTQVLYDINLAIKEESFVSIIGQSGSGKSTLLNIIGTLDYPTDGEVLINGVSTKKMKKNQLTDLRSETLGFIFQFHYLLPEFTAYENVIMPIRIQGKKITKEVTERAYELMDLMGILAVKDNPANNMSGGQQQRTAIARALMANPKIILADEPTGNLDSDSTEQVYELLRKINRKYHTTFIVITHDRRIAEKADRIIEIKDGKINMDIDNSLNY